MNSAEIAKVFVDDIKAQLLTELREAIELEIPKIIDQKRLNVEEAAKYIGVSEDILYVMVREGTIPHYKIGSSRSTRPTIRFRIASLDAWIREQESSNYTGKGT